MKSKYYVARDLWGGLFMYKGKPERRTNCWYAPDRFQQLDADTFPEVKWEDEPVEVTITGLSSGVKRVAEPVADLRVEMIEIAGFVSALRALRLPYGKEVRSEMHAEQMCERNRVFTISSGEIDQRDMALMKRLVRSGDEHAKVLRGIVVWAQVTAPVYWWCEAETYGVGHQRLSSESTMHIDCKGLTGEELRRAKAEIPMGKVLTKVDFFSYQCLRHIYYQRKGHRLQEWRQFCEWIEGLPYAKELIIGDEG